MKHDETQAGMILDKDVIGYPRYERIDGPRDLAGWARAYVLLAADHPSGTVYRPARWQVSMMSSCVRRLRAEAERRQMILYIGGVRYDTKYRVMVVEFAMGSMQAYAVEGVVRSDGRIETHYKGRGICAYQLGRIPGCSTQRVDAVVSRMIRARNAA